MRKAPIYMLIAVAAILGLLVIAVSPFVLFTPRAPKAPERIDSVDKLEAYLGALTAHETPPALDVVVLRNGAVAYSRAFRLADGPSQKPATPDGIYRVERRDELEPRRKSFPR